jgi:hypothetical protein
MQTQKPRRAPTLLGVAPPTAVALTWHKHSSIYRTTRQHDHNSRIREAVRVDIIRRSGK